jgi:hypothetical protein
MMDAEGRTQSRHHGIRLVTFNRGNGTPLTGYCVSNASSDRFAIKQHSARAADAMFAAKMSTRELHDVA